MQAFEIIRLAEKASFVWEELSPVERMMIYQFADLVSASEREACAGLAEKRLLDDDNADRRVGHHHACKSIAADIRARKDKQ